MTTVENSVRTHEEIAQAWVAYAHAFATREDEKRYGIVDVARHAAFARDIAENDWASDAIYDLVFRKPNEAWAAIQAILDRGCSRAALGLLVAGPLEDLLVHHGPAIIEFVEGEARANPPFARLLRGLWQGEMHEEIWRRIKALQI